MQDGTHYLKLRVWRLEGMDWLARDGRGDPKVQFKVTSVGDTEG